MLCFFFITIGYTIGQNQEKIDSLTKWINEAPNDTNKVKATYQLSIEHLYYNEDLARDYSKKTIKLASELNYRKGKAMGYSTLGHLGNVYADYDAAIENYLKAIKIYHNLNDVHKLAKTYAYVGDVYGFLGRSRDQSYVFKQKGLNAHLQSLKFTKQLNDTLELASIYQVLGNSYKSTNQYDSAVFCFNTALELIPKGSNMHIELGALNGLAAIHYMNRNFEQATELFNKILKVTPNTKEYERNLSSTYNNLGMSYMRLKKYNNAIESFEKSRLINIEENDLSGLKSNYYGLYSTYEEMGEYEKGFKALKRFKLLNDSITDNNTRIRINELQEEFEAEKRKQEIKNLNKENELLQTKGYIKNTIIISTAGIFILLLIVVWLFFKQRKSKEQKNQLELEQKALRAQMNPHFIFNSLNSIQRMFMEGDHDMANDYMADFGELMRIILENSGKSEISIKDELSTLKLYLDIEKMRTGGVIDYQINIDTDIDQLNSKVPPLIIQPFVENAIWHGILPTGNKGKIEISLNLKDKGLIACTITDNGVGIEESKKEKSDKEHLSRGMQLTESRLAKTNAVKAEQLDQGGTKITILIPVS